MTDTFEFRETGTEVEEVNILPVGVKVTLSGVESGDIDSTIAEFGEALGEDGIAYLRDAANAVGGDSFDFTYIGLEPGATGGGGKVNVQDLSFVHYVDKASNELSEPPVTNVFINGNEVGGRPDDAPAELSSLSAGDAFYDFFG